MQEEIFPRANFFAGVLSRTLREASAKSRRHAPLEREKGLWNRLQMNRAAR
jgi:hypothetical protein